MFQTSTLSSTINNSVNNNNNSTLPNNNSSSNTGGSKNGGLVNGGAVRRPSKARSLSHGPSGGLVAKRDVMDLRYVTERIIALWVPADVGRAAYLQGQQQAADMLRTKHGENYMVS